MKVNMDHVKNGQSGEWKIEDYEADSFWYKISLIKTGRGVPPGKYKRLLRGRECIMSNTPDEINDFMPFVRMAHRNILINGLGLGVVLTALLAKKEVTNITVVEKSQDVMKLVSLCFPDPRIKFVLADAYDFNPTDKYDFVWHDIWDHICSDNLSEMAQLHRKYAKKTTWQDSWCKRQCQRLRRRSIAY